MEKLTKILTTPISISKFSLFKLQFLIKKKKKEDIISNLI